MNANRVSRFPGLFLGLLASSGLVSAQAPANRFLDDSTVQVIHLTMDPADWAGLQKNYLLNTWYHATFEWNGITEAIGVRSHGGGSRSPFKPNLRLSFAKYDKSQTLLGLPIVLIKANNEDPSNLREWISMRLFRKMGIPAPRESPAQVFLNGQLLGFYYIVEFEEETFLARNFGENGGYLYEWNDTGYEFDYLGTDPALYARYLDLKTSQAAPDLDTLVKLVQVINQPAGPNFTDENFIAALSQYVEPKAFLTYGATEQALAGSDGLIGGDQGMNNFYLYQFQGTTLYSLIPWDKDFTFSDTGRDIMNGLTSGPNINLLAKRLASIPEYKQAYLGAIVKAASLLGGPGAWADQELTREYGLIRYAAGNDPNKQCMTDGTLHPCGTADFEAGVDYLHRFLRNRSDFVLAQAGAVGYVPATGGPRIASGGLSSLGGSGDVSPGAIVNIAGTALGPVARAATLPLPRIIGETFVTVEGVRAPLFSTSPGNIQFQIPGDIPPGDASVVVSTGGNTTGTEEVTVKPTTPNILAVLHVDGSAVAAGHPAVAVEILSLYATGLGVVDPDGPVGAAAGKLMATVLTPRVSLGNAAVSVTFSGLAPGFVGLYQLNLLMPKAMPAAVAAPLNVVIGTQFVAMQLALQ